jgi:hypothetical protein
VLAIYLRQSQCSKSHVAISPFKAGSFMPRALWKGAISFGLIYVPVELHTASKDNTLPLHMLDRRDFAAVCTTRSLTTWQLRKAVTKSIPYCDKP